MDNEKNNPQENSQVVAKINGKEIMREDLDFQIQKVAQSQQVPIPEEGTEERKNFEQKELDHMINDTLITQEAKKQDFQFKQEEIDSRYSALAGQVGGEEKLKKAVESMGTTIEQLKENLRNQIIVEQYLNSIKEKNNIAVTDEEVKEFYEKQVVPQNQGVELKDVEQRIRQVLEQQKLNEPLSEIIQNLRKEADITVSL